MKERKKEGRERDRDRERKEGRKKERKKERKRKKEMVRRQWLFLGDQGSSLTNMSGFGKEETVLLPCLAWTLQTQIRKSCFRQRCGLLPVLPGCSLYLPALVPTRFPLGGRGKE